MFFILREAGTSLIETTACLVSRLRGFVHHIESMAGSTIVITVQQRLDVAAVAASMSVDSVGYDAALVGPAETSATSPLLRLGSKVQVQRPFSKVRQHLIHKYVRLPSF